MTLSRAHDGVCLHAGFADGRAIIRRIKILPRTVSLCKCPTK